MQLVRSASTSLILAVAVATAASLPMLSVKTASAAQPDAKRADPLKEGLELAKAGKHEAALAKFEEAYALSRTGTPVYNIARMEQALGRHALALHHYREALRDPNLATDARRDAEKAIEELKTKVAVVAFDVPPGATTSLDGNEVDVSSTLEVVPGSHVVKIKLGGDTKSTDVVAPAGQLTTVKLRFGPDADQASPPHGADTPPPVTPPPTEADSSMIFTTRNIVGGSLGLLGVAAAAVGVGFLVGSEGTLSDAEAFDRSVPGGACTGLETCRQYDAMLDDARGDRTVSIVSFIGAGVFLAGAVATFVLWPQPKRSIVGSPRGFAVAF